MARNYPFATKYPWNTPDWQGGEIAILGNLFFVDSGQAGASDNPSYGLSPEVPFATIGYAVGRCTANNGDVVYVLPGHTDTISAADGLRYSIAGVRVVGIGVGRDRPTINFTATGSDIEVDVANCTLENVFLDLTGVDAVVGALDVNAADFHLKYCEVLMADASGQATEFIVADGNAHRLKVLHNVIRAPNAGANNAVSIEGTADGIEIGYNHIYGDFGDACIHNPTGNVATNVFIHDNYLQNDQTGDHAIELVSAVTGVIQGNTLVTDAIATAMDQGSCYASGNMYYDSSDTDAAATPVPETVTTGGHSLSQIADRLGADADTDAIAAALYGAAGIASFPAAAAPANAVSLAEALRAVYDRQLGDGTDASTNSILGKRVTKADANLPATTTQAIFTVGTGRVLITMLTGEVGTVIQAQACNLKVTSNPTAGSDVDLASNLDINADEAATLYLVEGDGTALVGVNAGAAYSAKGLANMVVPEGSIQIETSATNTGSTSWECWYIPLDDGATVVSA